MTCPRCNGKGEILVDLGQEGWDDQPCPDCAGSGEAAADQVAELRARVARLEAALSKAPSVRILEIEGELWQKRPFATGLKHEAIVRYLDECWRAATERE